MKTEEIMRKKSIVCFIAVFIMLFGCIFAACGKTDKPYVPDDEAAQKYEQNLDWGEKNHLYIHYLRGSHSESEQGKVNSATAPAYSSQIDSKVYGDWGLWVWEYFPTNSEGRAFFPMKIDESGAVYDIDLSDTYNDAGWNEATLNNKGLIINYNEALRLGVQVFSQDSRENGSGFWVNDGGDVYVILEDAKRSKGDRKSVV